MALNGLNGYISNYNAYNIPSATDNSQVRPSPAETQDNKALNEQQQKPE